MGVKRLALGVALLLLATEAQAQTVTLGAAENQGTDRIGEGLAAIISEHSELEMQRRSMAETTDYMPLVNSGEIDFGVADIVQTWFAFQGKGMSNGRPMLDLRLAAVLMPFKAGFVVPAESDIRTVADLAGRSVPAFGEGALGDQMVRGFLANAGITMVDVEAVPVPDFQGMWRRFVEGELDVAIVSVGPAWDLGIDYPPNGLRLLSFEETDDKLAAMQRLLPQMSLAKAGPSPALPAATAPVTVMSYPHTLFVNKTVPDETVYEAVKALHENEKLLVASGPYWEDFQNGHMADDVDVPFHPGAIKFYEEAGVWER